MSSTPFETPNAEQVNRIHENADTDGGLNAIHHTLGPLREQAAGGQHTHDGGDSVQLLADTIITGSKSSGAALASVISALVELGATDATTA